MSAPRTGVDQRPPVVIEVAYDLIVRLRPEARRRDMAVTALINDVLLILGEEPNLVGAILDDSDPGRGEHDHESRERRAS